MKVKEESEKVGLKCNIQKKKLNIQKTKRICHQQTYSKRIAKRNSPNRKETIKKIKPKSLGGRKKTQKTKILINTIKFLLFNFFKLCLMAEEPATLSATLSDVILYMMKKYLR